jgi:hypothetical protein
MDSIYVWLGIMVAVFIGVWMAAPYHHGIIDRRPNSEGSNEWD